MSSHNKIEKKIQEKENEKGRDTNSQTSQQGELRRDGAGEVVVVEITDGDEEKDKNLDPKTNDERMKNENTSN